MDDMSERLIQEFIKDFLNSDVELDVIDLGSYNINGTFRPFFNNPKWHYVGADKYPGPNVDIVFESDYVWGIDKKFDVVISANTMEHVQDLKEWVQQIPKILKPGGIVHINVPFFHMMHRSPDIDCWRVLQDGLRWLLDDVAELLVVDCFIDDRNTIGIAREKMEVGAERFRPKAFEIVNRGISGVVRYR